MSEQRYLLSEHLQKMHVTLLSLFGRVKTVLTFRKSRVFSRTRFQYKTEEATRQRGRHGAAATRSGRGDGGILCALW